MEKIYYMVQQKYKLLYNNFYIILQNRRFEIFKIGEK